jgi:TetR/AcrR family transcriptional regulator, cholesterol catabolism regulator
MPEERRRDRNKLATRDRIIRESCKLFDEKGFDATTVDEIVLRADVSKGTFFNYFGRKEAVLAFALEQRLAVAEAAAVEHLSLATPVRDKLLGIFLEAAGAWEDDRTLSRHVISALGSRVQAETPRADKWRELLRSGIVLGQKSGELRSDVAPERMEAMLTALYHETLARWVSGAKFTLQDELRAQITMMIEGLEP